jgi:hypothetical protein
VPNGAEEKMNTTLFLLFQINLPGTGDYITDAGVQQIMELHKKIYAASWLVLGLMVVIALAMNLAGLFVRLEISPKDVILRGLMIVCLMVGFDEVYGMIMAVGHGMAQEIMPDYQLADLTKSAQRAANNQIEGEESSDDGGILEDAAAWISGAANFLWNMVVNPGAGIAAILVALSIALFLFGAIFINMAWIALATVLYVMGPILIVFGIIPRLGGRVLTNWVTALVQLAAWRVWMAVCGWFVWNGPSLFLHDIQASGPLDFENTRVMIESAVMSLVFAGMYFATPFIVNAVLPLSRFSMWGAAAWSMAMNRSTGAVATFMRVGGAVAGAVGGPQGMAAGAAAGQGANIVQKIGAAGGSSGGSAGMLTSGGTSKPPGGGGGNEGSGGSGSAAGAGGGGTQSPPGGVGGGSAAVAV